MDEGKLEKRVGELKDGNSKGFPREQEEAKVFPGKQTLKIECFPTVVEFKTSCKTSKYLWS